MPTGTAAVITQPVSITAIGSVGGFVSPNQPNLADFRVFLATSAQIPLTALPATSPWPQYALYQALIIVPSAGVGIIFTLAVYNLATHLLLMITPDQPGSNFFSDARSRNGFNLINPSTGLVVTSSDETTSVGLAQPQWAKGLTISQLGYFKTPWGREYLGYIQSSGPSVVGLT